MYFGLGISFTRLLRECCMKIVVELNDHKGLEKKFIVAPSFELKKMETTSMVESITKLMGSW